MAEDLPVGTEITCPLCREETTTVERNKQDKPYFYCADLEAAVNMNAPVAHTESFLRQFLDAEGCDATGAPDATGASGVPDGSGTTDASRTTDATGTGESTDITTRKD